MTDKKTSEKKMDSESKIEEKTDDLLSLAVKAVENEIPIMIWKEKKDEGKYLFEIIDEKIPNEKNEFTDFIVHSFLITPSGKGKFGKKEFNFQIKPSALQTQIKKFKGLQKGQIVRIEFLGKTSYQNPETLETSESKSFIVAIYNPELNQFVTKPIV